jgi:DNA-binding NtrC family response regulator
MSEARPATSAVSASPEAPGASSPEWSGAGDEPYRTTLLLDSANAATARAIAMARQAATFEVPILLCGEGGTGKSELAFAVHDWSIRRAQPFVVVSCRGSHLARRDLRGVSEVVNASPLDEERKLRVPAGTLFLDEVGALSSDLQATLVRFLDEECAGTHGRPLGWGTRVIASTSRDLEEDVRTGRFRHDAFFRLNVVTIRLLPLRERSEDLPQLVDDLLTALCARHRRPRLGLTPRALALLTSYGWPGNVRELATVLEHATVLARSETIDVDDLPDRLFGSRR